MPVGLRRIPELHRTLWRFEVSSAKKRINYANHAPSVVPTRYFMGRPGTGEEMQISIEKGKMLIIRLMAVGPVVEGRTQRDVWFEVNGEVYYDFVGLCTIKLTHMTGPGGIC